MFSRSKYLPLILSAFVCPGAGQWYLHRKLKGGLMIGFALLLTICGMIRYFSILFVLINRHGGSRPPQLNPLPLLIEAWHLDRGVLYAFLAALAALWLLSLFDLILNAKENPHEA